MSDDKKNTRINPKHYIGKFASDKLNFFTASLTLSVGGAIGTGMAIHDNVSEVADNQGTEIQAETYARLRKQIDELDKEQANLEIAQAQYRLDSLKGEKTVDRSKIEALKDAFTMRAHATLADIFTHGDIEQEADISEKQMIELTEIFEEKIAPTENFGIEVTPETIAYLDEARQKIGKDIKDKTSVAQLIELEKQVNTERKNVVEASVVLPVPAWMFILLIGNNILRDKLSNWKSEDKRVPKKRRRRNKRFEN